MMRSSIILPALIVLLSFILSGQLAAQSATWRSDNGDGTFTNPLFYEEFSDPDMIRVGDYFYLTGTTMHSMPGLPILRSRDLVNWEFLTYALDRLDLGPQFRLEDGKNVYGRGIWAPSFRYHNGTFYIFSFVSGQKTQVLRATNPAGPWSRSEMKGAFHDLSVLFDDDEKVYMVWGYNEVHFARLTEDLTGIVPGSERIIFPKGSNMGEGSHFYKIDGRYYITSAWFNGSMRMPVARADHPEGPYEVNLAISIDEDFGMMKGKSLTREGTIKPADPASRGRLSMHQGGIIQTTQGEWWGFSMMDYNSIGRLTSLSPITWQDGWPYYGLPGNLRRTPRTWVKPATNTRQEPRAPYKRSDDFSAGKLNPIWQWSHVPVDSKWSLTERPGYLRLHTLPAASYWEARNTLTQRAVGPKSSPIATLDLTGLRRGDIAGLALANKPYAWIGVERTGAGVEVVQFDELSDTYTRVPISGSRIFLKADCDYLNEIARFSYSLDGKRFISLGRTFEMAYQMITFQGIRYTLFAYNRSGIEGGFADFDGMKIIEPHPRGLMRPIPTGREVSIISYRSNAGISIKDGMVVSGKPSPLTIVDMKLSRVALRSGGLFLSIDPAGGASLVKSAPGRGESFQWIETPTGELVLMSLVTNRFLRLDPMSGRFVADSPGPEPGGADGTRFIWKGHN